MNLRLFRNLALVASVVLLAGLVGYKLGTHQVSVSWQQNSSRLPAVAVINKEAPPANQDVDFSLFWQVWNTLETKFVDKTKLDSQKMVYGAISGMVSSLGDPYTVFLPPVQNKEVKGDLNGVFEGIGAQLGIKDKQIVVVAPLKDSPAEKAGIKTGDYILKVDGQDSSSWTLPEAVAKIRGPKGSNVSLQILHPQDNKPTDVKIVRDAIKVESIEWKVMDATASGGLKQEVVYLRLSRFGDTTNQEWDKAINEVVAKMNSDKNIKGMVFDLRNNPGGYLDSAVYLASDFLPDGVIVEQQSYTGDKQTYSVSRQGRLLKTPLVVIVNQGSASAAEILAGSLQVRKRAKVVGMQSFGKGSVQEAADVAGGAGLHVTVAKWLLPDGTWINGKGLTPDVKIELDDKDPTKDSQLDKAIEVLLGK